jgi:hypothetical protein
MSIENLLLLRKSFLSWKSLFECNKLHKSLKTQIQEQIPNVSDVEQWIRLLNNRDFLSKFNQLHTRLKEQLSEDLDAAPIHTRSLLTSFMIVNHQDLVMESKDEQTVWTKVDPHCSSVSSICLGWR